MDAGAFVDPCGRQPGRRGVQHQVPRARGRREEAVPEVVARVLAFESLKAGLSRV